VKSDAFAWSEGNLGALFDATPFQFTLWGGILGTSKSSGT
jgi:hypothetical protein